MAPGDEVLAVTTDRDGIPRGELLRWGLVPSWAKQPDTGLKMINARVETVADRPAFKRAFERYRCLIIADGFYEWRRQPAGPKQAFHITRSNGGLFAFAGLWSIWYGEGDRKLRTCTILTTAASSAIAPLHDRMPVILARTPNPPGSSPRSRPTACTNCSPGSARATPRSARSARPSTTLATTDLSAWRPDWTSSRPRCSRRGRRRLKN